MYIVRFTFPRDVLNVESCGERLTMFHVKKLFIKFRKNCFEYFKFTEQILTIVSVHGKAELTTVSMFEDMRHFNGIKTLNVKWLRRSM